MAIGRRHKVGEPRILTVETKLLNALRDGKLSNLMSWKGPVLNPSALSEKRKNMIFGIPVLHIPSEIDYMCSQVIEGMGYDQREVKVAFYEGHKEFRFEFFPPEKE